MKEKNSCIKIVTKHAYVLVSSKELRVQGRGLERRSGHINKKMSNDATGINEVTQGESKGERRAIRKKPASADEGKTSR